MSVLSRGERLARFGPGVGDRIRLGDTDLWVRVEEDRQAAGDEPIWGYAKNLRLGMTQTGRSGPSELDLVIVGAVVIDPLLGVVKADIGIKDGLVAGVGRAGNPEISDGIELVIGPHTGRVSGYGLIATPGAVDSHVHTVSPNLIPAALSAGVTTLITAGFSEPPATMERTLRGLETWPVNVGLQANARSTERAALEGLLDAGAIGFKIHEDYGAYPELIDATLRFADERDVSVSLHTDGLHESAELEDTVAAIAGRTVHAYHVEGSGGGHVPDVIGLVREASVICSSTTPTIPWGVSAADEAIPMTVVTHGGSFGIPDDMELIRDRVHPATMAAEGPLHELGAIQIVNSDSQGMGRIMETVRRTFQLAHAMKAWAAANAGGAAGTDETDDNDRVLRYLAKVTIEPAVTHGVAGYVGSLRSGRIADIVLWKPAYFGVKPYFVIKAGHAAWAPLGEGNASVRSAEPTRYGPDWAGLVQGAPSVAVTFVSGSAHVDGLRRRIDSGRAFLPISGCRHLTRQSMARNRAMPQVEVSPVDGTVTLDGRILAAEPLTEVSLSRRYFLR